MASYLLRDEKILSNCMNEIKHSLGMEVVIRKPVRSQASNRYYWVIMGIISKDIGENTEDLHSLLKLRVFGPKYVTIRGETIAIPKHSKDLNQTDFGKLIDAAEMLALSMGIVLPAAEHYGY